MANQITLSPPWYTLRNQLFYTLGQTPGVTVGDLTGTGPYTLQIDVKTCLYQAQTIRLIVPTEYTFGTVKVITQVYFTDPCTGSTVLVSAPNQAITTIDQVMAILKAAFWCNPLVIGFINVDGKVPPISQGQVGSIVGVIKPCVIQFFNDDISNLCNNYMEVASKVFQQIFNLSYGTTPIIISFTTYDEKCMAGAVIESACSCNTGCTC
ncbi:MAG: hypothetical protein ACRCW2_00140 [Cellulosilyticaceae bacterium]